LLIDQSHKSRKPLSKPTRQGIIGAAATAIAARTMFPLGVAAQSAGPETTRALLGYIALTDAAPLIIAKERALFAGYGMPDVDMQKQASWSGVRDNLVLGGGSGGIDGAHIVSPLPYLIHTGKSENEHRLLQAAGGGAGGRPCHAHPPIVDTAIGTNAPAGCSRWRAAADPNVGGTARPVAVGGRAPGLQPAVADT
jgi:nitrate/nitrite transport system substrate-binding protein